ACSAQRCRSPCIPRDDPHAALRLRDRETYPRRRTSALWDRPPLQRSHLPPSTAATSARYAWGRIAFVTQSLRRRIPPRSWAQARRNDRICARTTAAATERKWGVADPLNGPLLGFTPERPSRKAEKELLRGW